MRNKCEKTKCLQEIVEYFKEARNISRGEEIMHNKLFLTWLCFIIPIFMYGFIETEYFKVSIRWILLLIWIIVLFIIVLYKIWA